MPDSSENINIAPISQDHSKVIELATLRSEKEALAKEKETIQLELENLKQQNQKFDKVRKEQIALLNQELEKVKDELTKAQYDLKIIDRFRQNSSNNKQEIEVLKQEKERIMNEKEALQVNFENALRENQILEKRRLNRIAGLETSLADVERRLRKTQEDLNQMYIKASDSR